MLRLVSLAVACALWVTSAAGEPSRPLVGHIMALLAVFEEADVLPPEASPEANALIHALIQTQAALTKTTNPATRAWFAEALRRSEATGAEPNPREGLTSRALEAIVTYAETHPPTARPDVMAGFQKFNVSPADLGGSTDRRATVSAPRGETSTASMKPNGAPCRSGEPAGLLPYSSAIC